MTDNEIIKALEACKEKNHLVCNVCPLGRSGDCVERLAHNAFWLINRQKAEIDRLKNELHGKVEYIHEQREVIDEKKAEIERLQSIINMDIAVIGCRGGKCNRMKQIIRIRMNEVKAEAIREFAERIKSTNVNVFLHSEVRAGEEIYWNEQEEFESFIDDLVKEMMKSEE